MRETTILFPCCTAVEPEEPPKHPFEVTITFGTTDWEHVLKTMQILTNCLKQGGPSINSAQGGGYYGTHDLKVTKRAISPEAYREELEAWWTKQSRG